MIIKGSRPNPNDNRVAVGFQFGKIVKGVQGMATIVEITKIEQRENGLWPVVHYKAEWKPWR